MTRHLCALALTIGFVWAGYLLLITIRDAAMMGGV